MAFFGRLGGRPNLSPFPQPLLWERVPRTSIHVHALEILSQLWPSESFATPVRGTRRTPL
jgi:hypothetical protein